ncbi:M20 family metallopeptidase [Achromobacter sp. GG226]|uniref:M20 family metallopeptidase n=1 Tax=Verticiella alkaliphila TaxID=2779529 RepID=UPI001C0C045E|nr:M20 family metallopeptidase [Verticiella sp. GG226]MBU4610462.1 M20 family metallopeptidase [Verticiella sp. GG226]
MSHPESAQTLVDGISEWVRCESPSHDPATLRTMAELIATQARAAGLRVTVTELGEQTGPALVLSNRASDDERPGLLLLAHYDTVHAVGTLTQNALRIEDGKLYGPGTYDMKAGTYLALKALQGLTQPGDTALPVDFLLVPDEEIGSPWSRPLIESWAKRARYSLVCEPARANGGRCVTARKGTGHVWITAHGRPAHAGVAHEKGRSAIRELAHQVLALEAMTDYAAGVTVSVGTIEGGTTVNVVPGTARAVVDFRVPTPEAGEALLARIQALQPKDPDVRLEIDARLNRPPMPRTDATGALLAQVQALATQAGFTLEEAPMTGGGSDANFVAALGVPTLDGLGAEGDGAHTLWEHVIVETLPQRLAFWRLLLKHVA